MPADGGIRFGQYVLLRRIARGGMAEVFLAQQRGLEGFDRRVAVKRILPHLVDSPDFVKMFLGEAKLAAQLTHPNVVHIYDFGKVEGDYFIAMEYVEGVHAGQLFKAVERDRMSPTLVARIGADAAAALHYAHELVGPSGQRLGLVHRDVSPANIMVSYDGIVKLCDFGIAKAATLSDQKTNPGQVKGKYAYMSPEQTIAAPLDGRSDVFSLAIVLWELLAGKTIVPRGDAVAAMRMIRDGKLERLERVAPAVPPTLAKAIMWALEPKREQRATAADLANALEAFIKASPDLATPMQLGAWVRSRFPRDSTGPQTAIPVPFGPVGTQVSPGTSVAPSTSAAPGTQVALGTQAAPASEALQAVEQQDDDDGRETIMRDSGPQRPSETLIAPRPPIPPTPLTTVERRSNPVIPPTPLTTVERRSHPQIPPTPLTSVQRPSSAPRAMPSSGPRAPTLGVPGAKVSQLENPFARLGDNEATIIDDSPQLVGEPTLPDPDGPESVIVNDTVSEGETMMSSGANRPFAPSSMVPAPPPLPPTIRGPDVHRSITPVPAPGTSVWKRIPRRAYVVGASLFGIALLSFMIALAAKSEGTVVPVDAQVATIEIDSGFAPDAAVPVVVDADVTDAPIDAREPTIAPADTTMLEIRTKPEGATVKIGDQTRVAPASFGLPAGKHVVIAELAGWQTEKREVTLIQGVELVHEIAFTRRTTASGRPGPVVGKLTVRTTPYSEVFLGTRKLGETPFADLELPVGTYTLTFKNPQRPTMKRQVTITAGKTTKLGLNLPK